MIHCRTLDSLERARHQRGRNEWVGHQCAVLHVVLVVLVMCLATKSAVAVYTLEHFDDILSEVQAAHLTYFTAHNWSSQRLDHSKKN